MAYIERRVSRRRDASGRTREHVRYKVRYRDSSGKAHSETVSRRADAERREARSTSDTAPGRTPSVARCCCSSG